MTDTAGDALEIAANGTITNPQEITFNTTQTSSVDTGTVTIAAGSNVNAKVYKYFALGV